MGKCAKSECVGDDYFDKYNIPFSYFSSNSAYAGIAYFASTDGNLSTTVDTNLYTTNLMTCSSIEQNTIIAGRYSGARS